MKPVPPEVLYRLDRAATRDFGIPSLILMENAGRGVGEIISRDMVPGKILIVAGKGNNGGDGLVAARHLTNGGFDVRILLLAEPSQLTSDALLNFRIAEKMGIPMALISIAPAGEKFLELCENVEIVVDALFGIGLHSPVSGNFADAIDAMNRCRKPVYSIDIPSGLDAGSGQVLGIAVHAVKTMTLALPKTGLFTEAGPEHSGEVEIVDIGMPRALLQPYLD